MENLSPLCSDEKQSCVLALQVSEPQPHGWKEPRGNLIPCSLKVEQKQMLPVFVGDAWGMPFLWVATKALLRLMGVLRALHLGSEGKWNV